MRRADSGLWSESGTLSIATKNIATITNPNNNFRLNNENSLKVDCNNPSGNDIVYFLDCPSGTRRLTSSRTKIHLILGQRHKYCLCYNILKIAIVFL